MAVTTRGPARTRLAWWLAGSVVAAGAVTAGVLMARGDDTRGAATGQRAAQAFVRAIDAGDRSAAAAASCATFADQARSIAAAGADPGIDFGLGAVQVDGATGTAVVTETLRLPGSTQHETRTFRLAGSGGWLVCGPG